MPLRDILKENHIYHHILNTFSDTVMQNRKPAKNCRQLIILSCLLAVCIFSACTTISPETTVEAIIPLSGQYSDYGQRLQAGMETAVIRLNRERLQAGKPALTLSVTDTRSTSQYAVTAFNRAAARKPAVIIGPGPTDEARRLTYSANRAQLPLVMPVASGDFLTARGNYVLRMCSSDSQQADAIADYLFNTLGIQEIAVLIDLHKEGTYGRNLSQDMAGSFRSRGGRVTATEGFHNSDKSYREQLQRIIAAAPQGIFIPAIAPSAARFVREARLLGYEGWIIGGDAMAEPEFCANLDGEAGKILFTSQYSDSAATAEGEIFRQEFSRLHSYSPGDCEALGYDAVLAAVRAREAGETFIDGWTKIEGMEMTCGTFTLDTESNLNHPVFINTIAKDETTGRFRIQHLQTQE